MFKRFCAAAVVATACLGAAPVTHAQPGAIDLERGELVDLSYAYDKNTIFWPTAKPFELEEVSKGITEDGYFYSANNLAAAEHGGTHLDAPVHFAKGGDSAAEVPLSRLVGRAALLDVRARVRKDPDYLISPADIRAHERRYGRIGRRTILLLRTGFGKYWGDRDRYLGTALTGAQALPKLRFPGLSETAARMLAARKISAVGIDTASIDRGQSKAFESHRVLTGAQIPLFENVANLDRLPRRNFSVIALPMKIQGGSGGPLRAIAVVTPPRNG